MAARVPDAVAGVLREVAHEAASLPDPAMRALIPALVQAERELAADMANVVGMFGRGKYSAQMLQRALVQVRGAMNAIEKVRPEMRGVLAHAGRAAGSMATRHLARELQQFSAMFDKTLEAIPIIPAAKVAEGLLLQRFERAAAKWSTDSMASVRRHIAVGLLKGESVEQMAKRVVGHVPKGLAAASPEVQGSVLARGMFRRAMNQARTIVRTEVLNAYNACAHESIEAVAKDDPEIMEMWQAMLDSRVCPRCRRLDGEKKKPGGQFVMGYYGPPAHPCCRCTTVIWKKGWSVP